MNLRHLEVFHAIMQTGSVTAAAHMLNVTQPAISNVLRHAEQQLGFRLFERIAGRLQPTPEAQSLFPDVQEVFGRIDTLNRFIDNIRSGRSGRLAIAASPTFVNAYLPAALARLYEMAPSAAITVNTQPSARAIEEKVALREVDIGILYKPVADPAVVQEEIAHSVVICALPADSPLAGLDEIGPGDLQGVSVVGPGPLTQTGSAIQEVCIAAGHAPPQIALEVNSLQAACLMVAAGVGVGLVDVATMMQYPLPDVVFRRFRPRVDLVMSLIFAKDRPRSRLAMQLARELRQVSTLYDGSEAIRRSTSYEPDGA